MLKTALLNLRVAMTTFLAEERAQDLVEYSLAVALIAFGCVSAMKSLTSEISTTFFTVSSTLNSSL
jgi:Flp pilus assembly pilin Flp